MISRLFRNWRFRTAKPAFVPGENLRAYLTGFNPETGAGTVRIGDTRFTVTGASAAQLDQLVDLHIVSFDVSTATGEGIVRG